MTDLEKSYLVYKIICGKEKLILNDNGVKTKFWLIHPSPIDYVLSMDVYNEVMTDASLNGLKTEEEVLEILKNRKMWTKEDEDTFETAIKNIDNLKVGLYKAVIKREKDLAREGLARTRKLVQELNIKKNKLSDKTAEWVSIIAKSKYLVGKCLLRENETNVWEDDHFWKDPSNLLDEAFKYFVQNKISEKQIRELAKGEPWRSIWLCRACENSVFGTPASLLTDDQKSLIAWSKLYDNCYEDQERPPDSVIEEDDMFDGWLITKRREREKETKTTKIESAITNEKIANSSEVIILAAPPQQEKSGLTEEELGEIESLNTPEAVMIKKERMNELFKRGEVKEADMPDTKRNIMMQLNRMQKRP